MPPHPQLLQRSNRVVSSEQQRVLERQALLALGLDGQPPASEDDLPPSILNQLKAHAEGRKRNSGDAALYDKDSEERVSKVAKTSHSSPAPSTPLKPQTPSRVKRRTNAAISSEPPSSSPGTPIDWTPSPDRTKTATMVPPPPAKHMPTIPPAPSFQSTGPEEPLEVELPWAQHQPPSTARAQSQAAPPSQVDTPTLREKAHTMDTPTCGQHPESISALENQSPPRPGLYAMRKGVWPKKTNSKPRGFVKDLRPIGRLSPRKPKPAISKPTSPLRSSLPSSESVIPASMQAPPAGQSVPHPLYPAPRQPSSNQRDRIPRSSDGSEEIVGLTQGTAQDQSQSAQGGFPLAQTMSYVSPDLPSSSALQEDHRREHEGSDHGEDSVKIEESVAETTVAMDSPKPTTATMSHSEQSRARISEVDGQVTNNNDREPETTSNMSSGPAAMTSQPASHLSATQKSERLPISSDKGSGSPFDMFCKAYPDFTGTLPQFVKACVCLEWIASKKILHQSLFDDFVGVFPKYLVYIQRTSRSQQLRAADWYNDREDDILYAQRLINKQNLEGILGHYEGEVQKCQQKTSASRQHRKVDSRSASAREQSDLSSRISKNSIGRDLSTDTRVIANTQLDEGVDGKRSNDMPISPPPMQLKTKSSGRQMISPPSEKDTATNPPTGKDRGTPLSEGQKINSSARKVKAAGKFWVASEDMVENTPVANMQRQQLEATAIPPKLFKATASQRHSTGTLPDKDMEPCTGTLASGPSVSNRKGAMKYLRRLGRKSSDSSSFSRSDAS